MLKSMTGFGRCEISEEARKLTIEMKAVNHRYLDMNIRMPKKLMFFESAIRNELKQYLQRGKVDIFVSYEDTSEQSGSLVLNEALAAEYMQHLKRLGEAFEIENDIRVSTLSRYPDVLTMQEEQTDEEELWKFVKRGLDGAAKALVETRAKEGENLRMDILEKLESMTIHTDYIEARSPEIVNEYRQKLEDKVAELLAETAVDENRISAEVVIYADKICTDEETVRLKSHIEHMRDTLDEGGNIGRKLDFIAQEMNREANTILSKANDLEVSNHAIDLKTDIEKIREQIQNIE